MNISNYNNFIVWSQQKPRGYDIYYYFFNATSWTADTQNVSFTGQYIQGHYETQWSAWSGSNTISNNNSSNILANGSYYSRTENDYNKLRAMMYTLDNLQTTPITFVGMQAMGPQFSYLQFENSISGDVYNGNLFTYYYQGDFYSQYKIKLGDIVNNDTYYYEIRLLDNVTDIVKGTTFVSLNVDPINIYNDGALELTSDYQLNIITRLLDYSKQYRLEITSYYGNGGTNLDEIDHWYIFLPQNAIISGDYILSFGSGDFTVQDSTNTIVDNNEHQTQNIIDSITNFTPVTSGEILSNVDVMPFYSGDSVDNFFVDILSHISDVFLLDNEVNLQVTLPIFAHTISIPSNFFITRNYIPELADFIEGVWWVLICISIVYKIDILVELFNFGDFINASYQLYQTRRLL